MRRSLLALTLTLALSQGTAAQAQLDEPEATCFEPIKPACAEVTIGSEDEGWAMRCREELSDFLEELEGYRQCVNNRLEQIQSQAESEVEQMDCLIDEEAQDC